MKNCLNNKNGASLIAAVLVLLIFSLFIAVAVSLVTTGANIALQEEQGIQALFIADGGLQYAAKLPFPNAWTTIPQNLGSGSFTTSVPTLQTALPNNNNPVPSITVSSTDGFLQASPPGNTNYWLLLCDTVGNPTPTLTISSTCEKLSFTAKTATTFTTGTRDMDNSAFAAHALNAVILMYTWDTNKSTTLNGVLNPCNAGACVICVNNDPLTRGFASSGFIRISDATPTKIEDVSYTGTGNTAAACGGGGCTACFTGGTRNAFNGNGRGTGNNHANGTNVYQSEISVLATSTGTVSNIIAGNVTRRVQGALMPLQ